MTPPNDDRDLVSVQSETIDRVLSILTEFAPGKGYDSQALRLSYDGEMRLVLEILSDSGLPVRATVPASGLRPFEPILVNLKLFSEVVRQSVQFAKKSGNYRLDFEPGVRKVVQKVRTGYDYYKRVEVYDWIETGEDCAALFLHDGPWRSAFRDYFPPSHDLRNVSADRGESISLGSVKSADLEVAAKALKPFCVKPNRYGDQERFWRIVAEFSADNLSLSASDGVSMSNRVIPLEGGPETAVKMSILPDDLIGLTKKASKDRRIAFTQQCEDRIGAILTDLGIEVVIPFLIPESRLVRGVTEILKSQGQKTILIESGDLSDLQKQLKGMIKAGVAPVKWDKSGFSFSLQEKEDRAIPFPSDLDDDLSISLDPVLFKKCLPESGDVLVSFSNASSPVVVESNEIGKAIFMPMSKS